MGLSGEGRVVRFADDAVFVSTEANANIAEELCEYVCPRHKAADVADEARLRGFDQLASELDAVRDVRAVRNQLFVGAEDPRHDNFLRSFAWRRVRMVALARSDGRCDCCGRSAKHGIALNVDHIKPRRDYPWLALDPTNLQVLCVDCNHGKGNLFQIDWRNADCFRDK